MAGYTDEYKKTEAWLYNYKNLDTAIKQYDIEIQSILNDIANLKGIDYSTDKLSPSNNIISSVENEVICRDEKLNKLIRKRAFLIKHKEQMDIAINNLNTDQRDIFELWYVKGCSRKEIIISKNTSKNSLYRWRREIVLSVINSMNPQRTIDFIHNQFNKK